MYIRIYFIYILLYITITLSHIKNKSHHICIDIYATCMICAGIQVRPSRQAGSSAKTGRERGGFLPLLPAVTAVIAGLGMCYSYCHDLLVICKVGQSEKLPLLVETIFC